MTPEEKINYLRIALALVKIGVNNEMADRIITIYEKVLEKEGKFSIEDAVYIEILLTEKYKREELNDT